MTTGFATPDDDAKDDQITYSPTQAMCKCERQHHSQLWQNNQHWRGPFCANQVCSASSWLIFFFFSSYEARNYLFIQPLNILAMKFLCLGREQHWGVVIGWGHKEMLLIIKATNRHTQELPCSDQDRGSHTHWMSARCWHCTYWAWRVLGHGYLTRGAHCLSQRHEYLNTQWQHKVLKGSHRWSPPAQLPLSIMIMFSEFAFVQ